VSRRIAVLPVVVAHLVACRLVAAQASPYLPLDHPLLPLVEHLVARGELADPSPLVRPFLRAELARLLDSVIAPAGSASGRAVAGLRERFRDRDDPNWFRVEPRGGVQAFSRARRDLLHPGGDGGARFYAEAAIEARIGSLVLVSRPIAENRLKLDPDWAGGAIQRTKNQAYRFADAYLGAQLGRVRLFYGQMARNWGPAGAPGIGLSSYGYPRSDVGLELRLRDLQLDVVATELTPMRAAGGVDHRRYLMAHRLAVRVARSLHLAVWETAVLAGPDQSFEPYFRNPLVLLAFPAQFGLSDNRNTLVGGDLQWRLGRGLVWSAQAAVDDRWRRRDDPDGTGEAAHPGRWAFTLGGAGALGRSASWRATLAVVNSLAFRTSDSTESLIDRGVGIGPHFTDNVMAAVSVSTPLERGGHWLLSPDLAVLWQGEGRIDAPFPVDQALTDTPELFIGTVATTYRLGATLSGGGAGVGIQATAGLHHTTNADQIRGRSRTRLEGRLLATLGLAIGGALR
jgi:hypothetical protein